MTIQQLPTYTGEIPALGQEQSQFNTNVSDKLAYDAQLVPAQNTYATEANALAVQVQSYASDSESSAAAAQSAADSVAGTQFVRSRIGNISDYAGDTLTYTERFNIYQFPDNSGDWYGVNEDEAFPITIPADPTVSGSGWSLVNGASQDYVTSKIKEIRSRSNLGNGYVETLLACRNNYDLVPDNFDDFKSGIIMPGGGAESYWQINIESFTGLDNRVYVDPLAPEMNGVGDKHWQCVIKYSDGDFEFNVIKNTFSDGFELMYPLQQDPTNATLGAAQDGVHYTRLAMQAWVLKAARTPYYLASLEMFTHACNEGNREYNTIWASNQAVIDYGIVNENNVVTRLDTDIRANVFSNESQYVDRATVESCGVRQGSHLAGHGVVSSINVESVGAGVLEFCVSNNISNSIGIKPQLNDMTCTVEVFSEDILIYTDKSYPHVRNFQIPFSGSKELKISIYSDFDGEFYINLQELKVWDSNLITSSVFDINEKTVMCGDSWFAWFDGGAARWLNEEIERKGGTGVALSSALGGQTSQWAIGNFNELIKDKDPDHVIFNFSTNDVILGFTYDEWKSNLDKLRTMCNSLGIRATFLRPCDDGQTQYEWNAYINRGLASSKYRPTSDELSDSGTFINNFGKSEGQYLTTHGGQQALSPSGGEPSAPWSNPAYEAIVNLEGTVYDYSLGDKSAFTSGSDVGGFWGAKPGGSSVSIYETGDNSGNTFTPSVVNGEQRLQMSRTTGGGGRLKFKSYNLNVGDDVLIVGSVVNSTQGETVDLLHSYAGGYNFTDNIQDAGSQVIDSSGSMDIGFIAKDIVNVDGDVLVGIVDPTSVLLSVESLYMISLNELASSLNIDFSGMTDSQIYNQAVASLNKIPPKSIRITDSVTGSIVLLSVESGVLVIS